MIAFIRSKRMSEAVKVWGRYKEIQQRMNGAFSHMQCSRCGEIVFKNDRYCRRCGAKFIEEEQKYEKKHM